MADSQKYPVLSYERLSPCNRCVAIEGRGVAAIEDRGVSRSRIAVCHARGSRIAVCRDRGSRCRDRGSRCREQLQATEILSSTAFHKK